MRRRLFALLVLFGGILAVVNARGADDDNGKPNLPEFPQPGSEIPGPCRVLNITGMRRDRYHCLVCRNVLQPAAAIFVRPHLPEAKEDQPEKPAVLWVKEKLAADQPLLHLVKKLDTIIDKNPDGHMGTFFVFLAKGNEQAPFFGRLRQLPAELGMSKPPKPAPEDEAKDPPPIDDGHVVFCVDNEVPENWKLNPEDEMTVVLYSRHKVVKHWAFKEIPTDKELNEIVAVFDKMVPAYARPDKKPKLRLPD